MFEKPAPADYPIHDLLRRRWSTRAFEDRLLTLSEIRTLFEAARWAPSSGNGQPWSFIIATRDDTENFERLGSALVPGNAWAKKAAVLALSVAQLERAPGKPNGHAWHDCGLASENIAIQATALGLAVHMMGGFSSEIARQACSIPAGFDPVTMFAIGHPAHPETLGEELRAKDLAARQRKPLHDFVFRGVFGQTGALD